MSNKWAKIERDIRRGLQDHEYTLDEVARIAQCPVITVKKWADKQLLIPTGTKYRYLYQQDQLDKAVLMYKLSKEFHVPPTFTAALFDEIKERRARINLDSVLERARTYSEPV